LPQGRWIAQATLIAVTAIGLAASAPAGARTFEVTRGSDPVPGACRPNDCSLREAVIAANERAGGDVVELEGGETHRIQIDPVGAADPETGDLEVTDKLTVAARGGGRAFIDANDRDRIFEVVDGGGLTLNKLFVFAGASDGSGGAVLVETFGSASKLRVDRSAFVANAADNHGGAIAANGDLPVRVTHSVFSHNDAGGSGGGGGLWADDGGTFKDVTFLGNRAGQGGGLLSYDAASFEDVKVKGNRAFDVGGGLYLYDYEMPISDSLIVNNRSEDAGGGIFSAYGEITIKKSTVRGNEAGTGIAGAGGGIEATGGKLLVYKSSIVENTAHGFGGGVQVEAGTTTRFQSSTLARNAAVDGYGGGGLAARDTDTDVWVTNSTFWRNRAVGFGGGIEAFLDASVAIASSTLVGNSANSDSAGGETGGGVGNGAASVTLDNSLLARNDAGGGPGRDCAGDVDTVGANLVQHPGGCAGVTDPPDITGVNPRTLPLRDNGGPTKTVAIRPNSPARNAASDGLRRDQRGVVRRNPDIGAFEYVRRHGRSRLLSH
jgi:hypothetical protein